MTDLEAGVSGVSIKGSLMLYGKLSTRTLFERLASKAADLFDV